MRAPAHHAMVLLFSSHCLLGICLSIGACSSSSSSPTPPAHSPVQSARPVAVATPPDVTIFLTAELKGSTEPCGCTSDPLGDLARTANLIDRAKARGPVLVFDGGSTLYTEVKPSAKALAQEGLKSQLIVDTFTKAIAVDAMGLGPYDFGEGIERVRPPRLASNVSAASGLALRDPLVLMAGTTKVGVFGVVSPSALDGLGVQVSDVNKAARTAIASLRKQGAQIIVALAQMTKAEARGMAKQVSGINFLLISQNLPEPDKVSAEAMRVGDTWLFMPANRGQVVSRLQLWQRDNGSFSDAVGDVRAAVEIERMGLELDSLNTSLLKWKSDPRADQRFVATKRDEVRELTARRDSLRAVPLQSPRTGNFFTLGQIEIRKSLDCRPDIVTAKRNYDRDSGLANVRAAAGSKPTPAASGSPRYVGVEDCEMCHKEAAQFWKGTKHAEAWETLEKVGKEFNFDCIGCHVVAFDQPGGSSIASNEHLRDVQCEQCHGPGSIHVDAEKNLRKSSILLRPKESVCAKCHTPEHSDTFDYKAYLRDITGPGHGAAFRQSLGDGKTGHELRNAAEAKAGTHVGKGCPK